MIDTQLTYTILLVDEIIAILGHEIGHYKMKHIYWTIALSTLQQGFLFYFMQFFITSKLLSEAFFMDHVAIYSGLIFFSQLVFSFCFNWMLKLNPVRSFGSCGEDFLQFSIQKAWVRSWRICGAAHWQSWCAHQCIKEIIERESV